MSYLCNPLKPKEILLKAQQKILIIQTAFIGDVVLSTPIIEALRRYSIDFVIDILVRKGNESLLHNHPILNKIWVWDKKHQKIKNQFHLIRSFRSEKYDYVINLQRFLSSGLFTLFSGSKRTIGFDKNPLSFLFSHSIKHQIQAGIHETERNLSLLTPILGHKPQSSMVLYPSMDDFASVQKHQLQPYLVIAPTSVWFTKQYPENKWIDFIQKVDSKFKIFLIGGPTDRFYIQSIISKSGSDRCENLAGNLSFLQSAALMYGATMNYVNDSAPLHLASALNAPTAAIFCSTTPDFGFGPLSELSEVIETTLKLDCKPCGLHGKNTCPKNHFDCAQTIQTEQLLKVLEL